MTSGVDELIHVLLDEIALRSGLSYPEIELSVKEFYSSQHQRDITQRADFCIRTPPAPKVDGPLLEKTWQWLLANPDVHAENIRQGGSDPDSIQPDPVSSTTQSIVGSNGSLTSRTANGSALEQADTASSAANQVTPSSTEREAQLRLKYDGLVLRTTEKRIWQAIAGHDVDHSRIPKAPFDLLRIIAAAGSKGIFQTDLIKQSDQDKRSIPKRTDDLHRNRYIVKVAVRRAAEVTSHCVLRKFVQDVEPIDQRNGVSTMSSAKPTSTINSSGVMQKERFLDSAMEIIKAAGVITFDEFRQKMATSGAGFDLAQKDPWIWQMELVGLIQRIQAKPSGARKSKATIKSLQFVHDITTEAREAYMKFAHKDRHALWMGSRDNESAELPPDPEQPQGETSQPLLALSNSKTLATADQKVTWTPQQPLENQIYDTIHGSGVNGMSTLEVTNKLTGLFAYRSIEAFLRFLSNVWQESQPPHLQHLAIVRDTSMEDGVLHYHYWSYPNFNLAVNAGLVSWEAVNEAYESLPKTKSGAFHKSPTEYLDEWEFPRISYPHVNESQNHEMTKCMKRLAQELQRRPKKGMARMLQTGGLYSSVSKAGSDMQSIRQSNIPERDNPGTKILKVHTDFEDRVWNHANFLMINQTKSIGTDKALENSAAIVGDDDTETTGQYSPGNSSPKQVEGAVQENASAQSNVNAQLDLKRKSVSEPTEQGAPKRQKTNVLTQTDMSTLIARHSTRNSRNEYLEALDVEQKKLLKDYYQQLLSMTRPALYIKPPQRLPRLVGRPKKNLLLVIKSDRLKDLHWFRDSSIEERFDLNSINPFDIPEGVAEEILSFEEDARLPNQSSTLHRVQDTSLHDTQRPVDSSAVQVDSTLKTPAANTTRREEQVGDEVNLDSRKRAHSFGAIDSSPKRTKTTSVNSNTPVLPSGNGNENIETNPLQLEQNILRPQPSKPANAPHNMSLKDMALKRSMQKAAASPGVTLTGGSLAKHRSDMILDLVKRAGGAYPGGSQIWLPFITAVQKLDQNLRIDINTVERAVKNLIKSGKLKSLHFAFETNQGFMQGRTIICQPELDRESEVVKKVETGIRENFPQNYVPDGIEVDNSLKDLYHSAPTLDKDAPTRRSGFVPRPDIEIARYTIGEGDEEQLVNEDERALQSSFEHDAYSNQPETTPQTRSAYRKRLSNKDSIDSAKVGSLNNRTRQDFQFVIQPETQAAEHQEMLREHQAYIDELQPHLSHGQQNMDQTHPNSWIISWSRVLDSHAKFSGNVESAWPNTKLRLALCVTFADPDQIFQSTSGTFSTEFAVVRDIRPRLRVSTSMQRDYESMLPHTLLDIVQKAPRRSNRRQRRNPQTFETIVDTVERWEQNNEELLSANSLLVPRFIHYQVDHMDVSKPEPYVTRSRVHVARKNQRHVSPNEFDISEIPFQHLDDSSDEISTNVQSATKQSDELLNLSTRSDKARFKRPRTHNSLISEPPVDPQLFSETRSEWQTVSTPSRLHPNRARKKTSSDPRRTAVAVIIARNLLSNTTRSIPWNAVERAISDKKLYLLKNDWRQFSTDHPGYVENVEKWFQDSFLEAYEAGIVPPFDYNDIDGFNWTPVIDWALEHVGVEEERREESVDQTRPLRIDEVRNLQDNFQVHEKLQDGEEFIRNLLIPSITQYRREMVLTDLLFAKPLTAKLSNQNHKGQNAVDTATSYVRSNVFAPLEGYDEVKARGRLELFSEDALEAAINILQRWKIVKQESKGRAAPGRNYSVAKSFHDSFKGNWTSDMLVAAVQYKYALDRDFSEQGTSEYSPHASDGQILAIMNLYEAGRLNIQLALPPITTDPSKPTMDSNTGDRYMSIWGFTEGNYKTVSMNLKNLSFPIHLTPTAKWINGIPLPEPMPDVPAPYIAANQSPDSPMNLDKGIPVWFDIHDRFLPEMWRLTMTAITTTLGLAPGSSVSEISAVCKDALFEWEVTLALEWLQSVGVVEKTTDAGDRFVLREWWWAILGSI